MYSLPNGKYEEELESIDGINLFINKYEISPNKEYIIIIDIDINNVILFYDLLTTEYIYGFTIDEISNKSFCNIGLNDISIKYSPNSKLFIIITKIAILVYDIYNTVLLGKINNTDNILAIDWLLNGKYIIFTFSDCAKIYDIESEQLIKSICINNIRQIIPTGEKYIVIDLGYEILIYTADSFNLVNSFDNYDIEYFKILPDEKHILFYLEDESIHIKNIKTGKLVKKIKTYQYMVLDCVFSPSGKYIMVVSDENIDLYEFVNKSIIYIIKKTLKYPALYKIVLSYYKKNIFKGFFYSAG